MFTITIHVFQMDIICILMKYYFNIMYFKIILFAFQLNIIFMFMIIIQVFKMDIDCILMKYYLMFMIVIHVFQKYCICILINETLF